MATYSHSHGYQTEDERSELVSMGSKEALISQYFTNFNFPE